MKMLFGVLPDLGSQDHAVTEIFAQRSSFQPFKLLRNVISLVRGPDIAGFRVTFPVV